MLQAILHSKFGRAIKKGKFEHNEDSLTSSVIGLMQYLPDVLFWRILKGACGRTTVELPDSIGLVLNYHFWERFDAKDKKIKNKSTVEPDVWIETDMYDILVEVKRSDNSGDNSQYEEQWTNQILSLLNSYGKEKPKPLIYIAIGGNDSLHDTTLQIGRNKYIIHTASWYLLLNAVLEEMNDNYLYNDQLYTRRVLFDIVQAMQVHRIIKATWLESLLKIKISDNSDQNIYEIWDFDNSSILTAIKQYHITNKTDLSTIWTLTK